MQKRPVSGTDVGYGGARWRCTGQPSLRASAIVPWRTLCAFPFPLPRSCMIAPLVPVSQVLCLFFPRLACACCHLFPCLARALASPHPRKRPLASQQSGLPCAFALFFSLEPVSAALAFSILLFAPSSSVDVGFSLVPTRAGLGSRGPGARGVRSAGRQHQHRDSRARGPPQRFRLLRPTPRGPPVASAPLLAPRQRR